MNETKSKSRVAAVILAAGTSSRMGTAKQLLQVGAGTTETLLERVIANVRRSRAGETVVVLGHAEREIRERIPFEGVRVVVNENYREGMGTSLGTGIAALGPQAKAALIVLADQPFVRPATFDRLIEEYEAQRPQILVPVYRGFRGNPVLVERSVFPELMHLKGEVGCRAIFSSHLGNIRKVPVDDAGILADIDEAGDVEKLRRFVEGRGGRAEIGEAIDLAGRDELAAGAAGAELVLVGREPVLLALAKLARVARFRVTLVDPLATPEESPEADRVLCALDFSQLPANPERYVVIASRGKFDEDAVELALEAGATYVALVARKARAQEILERLGRKGVPREKLGRVRAPAGLAIGAETPEEIAVSILAEIVAQRRGRA